jgi:hypothetical protein
MRDFRLSLPGLIYIIYYQPRLTFVPKEKFRMNSIGQQKRSLLVATEKYLVEFVILTSLKPNHQGGIS